jgi:acylphosphatase
MRQEAERLGLTGWVRNRVDGEVEAVAQGGDVALDALVNWAWQGPPAAHVARVECSAPPAEYERGYARFERWPTA